MCGAGLAVFAAILVLLCLESDTRQALAVTPLWFVLLGLAYRAMLRRLGGAAGTVPAQT